MENLANRPGVRSTALNRSSWGSSRPLRRARSSSSAARCVLRRAARSSGGVTGLSPALENVDALGFGLAASSLSGDTYAGSCAALASSRTRHSRSAMASATPPVSASPVTAAMARTALRRLEDGAIDFASAGRRGGGLPQRVPGALGRDAATNARPGPGMSASAGSLGAVTRGADEPKPLRSRTLEDERDVVVAGSSLSRLTVTRTGSVPPPGLAIISRPFAMALTSAEIMMSSSSGASRELHDTAEVVGAGASSFVSPPPESTTAPPSSPSRRLARTCSARSCERRARTSSVTSSSSDIRPRRLRRGPRPVLWSGPGGDASPKLTRVRCRPRRLFS